MYKLFSDEAFTDLCIWNTVAYYFMNWLSCENRRKFPVENYLLG